MKLLSNSARFRGDARPSSATSSPGSDTDCATLGKSVPSSGSQFPYRAQEGMDHLFLTVPLSEVFPARPLGVARPLSDTGA